ncbi:restriction system-associated AAA family ATPase [Zhongshania aquimaris]|uniref:Restriction system-associated AAA family ATPase n=1 Tax=Zhongshania aquimaris TaxID=2857107 RepID=A0ABS6VQC0_9GAMM|nr:restriction system-associated AAA family ATPase [Zhongshania aquimaris]MBW2940512.1 restriction system-associated AAA family ATPase [Zhongshania aquimaris]
MKLVSLKIIDADTCGGLLNGLSIPFREGQTDVNNFSPLCLIGPNGTGKSQVLQIIAEIFQAVFAKYLSEEEKGKPNDNIQFEIEYILGAEAGSEKRVRIYRRAVAKKKLEIVVENFVNENWSVVTKDQVEPLLPKKVIGYTSGDNETLSIPFFVSRAGYASQVRDNATKEELKSKPIPDSRMLLIDYATNLEVLVANLLLNDKTIREHLIKEPNLKALRSFRCVIQLKYGTGKKVVQLTDELQGYVGYLERCATCYHYDSKTSTYTFDFYIQGATHAAFGNFWEGGALELYSCFHKLAMLNDLVIPKQDREEYEKGVTERRFASRLPEPMERQKVFRFERVEFISNKSDKPVDYVSLSDGEHQLAQLLGTLCMVNYPNVLFLLDEPESHFNPRWRVEFISKILNLPTCGGVRNEVSEVARQDCLITTHSPFVPSDMKSDNVLVFKKDDDTQVIDVRRPKIETFGSTFDTILEECFSISPPISDIPRLKIEELLKSDSTEEIQEAMRGLGDSVERMYLADRVRQLKAKGSAGA